MSAARIGCIYPDDIVDWCFQDLAPYLRDPAARSVVHKFIELCGTDSSSDVYLNLQNVRFLDPKQLVDGPAAVTIVVNNFGRFNDLIKGHHQSSVEVVHVSHGDFEQLIEGNEEIESKNN